MTPSENTPASGATEEVEWQYTAPSLERVAAWLQGRVPAPFRAEPGFPRDLHDTYYDTPGWRLYRAGVACRVRQKGEDAELTLKTMAGAVDDIRTRSELNEALTAGDMDDPAQAPGPAGDAIRATIAGEALKPLFRLHTARQVYALSDDDRTLGEVALDSTTIDPTGAGSPLQRVEVETTDVERARPFVEALVAANELGSAESSKFQAGLAAAGLQLPAAPGFGSTRLKARMPARDYALAILRSHLATAVANEPGTRLGMDPEYLHDMRVALRRIRAAVSAFAHVLPAPVLDLREELRWLTRSLGPVRDLDVQLQRLSEWRHQLPGFESTDLDPLERVLREQRAEERTRMLAALDSNRYQQLVDGLARALQDQEAPASGAAGEPAAALLPGLVKRRHRQVSRDGRRIAPGSSAAEYHQLRIRARKLRYTAEFAAPVTGKPGRKFVRRVKALQDILGLHQDAEVARQSLRQLAADHADRLPPDTLLAMGADIERYRAQEMDLRTQYPDAFSRVRGKAWKRFRRRLKQRRSEMRKA